MARNDLSPRNLTGSLAAGPRNRASIGLNPRVNRSKERKMATDPFKIAASGVIAGLLTAQLLLLVWMDVM